MSFTETITTVRGNPFPQLRRTKISHDPSRGWKYDYDFDAATQVGIAQLADSYAGQGCSVELTLENDKGSLTVEDPTQLYTIDTWNFQGNELELDGFSHPTITAFLTPEMAAKIRAGIENAQSGTSVPVIIATILNDPIFKTLSGYTAVPGQAPGGIQDDPLVTQCAILYYWMGLNFRGSPNFLRAQYVLRHTSNVSNRTNTAYVDMNTLQIYSISAMLTEIQAATWAYPCPAQTVTALLDATTNLANFFTPSGVLADLNYALGWLKKPSTRLTTAYNRIDITTEYVLDLWSTLYYPSPVGF